MWFLTAALAAPIGELEAWAPSPSDRQAAEALGLVFGEGVDGPWVRYHGTATALDLARTQLLTRGYRADHRRLLRAEGYHTPDTLQARLEELAEDPRATLVQVGVSVEGRPLLALRMGPAAAPAWRILGAHHGDELSSSELGLAVAEALLRGEGAWEGLLDRVQVWVLPAVNPDGMVAGSRFNANDVDLNRNYDWMWEVGFTHGAAPFSEPETRAVRSMSLYAPFFAGLSLHSGAENIGYPWNWSFEDSPDEARLWEVGERYTGACGVEGFYTTNGADWYVTEGDTNDWSLGRRGTWDFTVELSEVKTPPAGQLEELVQAHLVAVAELMAAPPSLRGQVVSSQSGHGLEARIEVRSSSSLWTGPAGNFARPLEVGVYELEVSAPGYLSQTVQVGLDTEGTDLLIALEPQSLLDWRLQPSLVSQATDEVRLSIEGVSPLPARARLTRSGFDPVDLVRDGDAYPLRPASLEQGPWTFESDEGVLPRALLVGAPDTLVRIGGVTMVGSRLLLHGEGFAPGTRAFALFGLERQLVELEALGGSADWVGFEASSLPSEGTVDLLLVSNGREVGVADLLGTLSLDTAEPEPSDSGHPETGRPRLVPAGYRGCSSIPAGASGLWLLLLLARRTR